jgi:hypothetical protein
VYLRTRADLDGSVEELDGIFVLLLQREAVACGTPRLRRKLVEPGQLLRQRRQLHLVLQKNVPILADFADPFFEKQLRQFLPEAVRVNQAKILFGFHQFFATLTKQHNHLCGN